MTSMPPADRETIKFLNASKSVEAFISDMVKLVVVRHSVYSSSEIEILILITKEAKAVTEQVIAFR